MSGDHCAHCCQGGWRLDESHQQVGNGVPRALPKKEIRMHARAKHHSSRRHRLLSGVLVGAPMLQSREHLEQAFERVKRRRLSVGAAGPDLQ